MKNIFWRFFRISVLIIFLLAFLGFPKCPAQTLFVRVEGVATKVNGVVTNDTTSRLGKVANLFNAGANAEALSHGSQAQNISLDFSSLKYGEKGITATTSIIAGVLSETGFEAFARLGRGVYKDASGTRIGIGGSYYILKPETLQRLGKDAQKFRLLAKAGIEVGYDGSTRIEFNQSGVMESINDQLLGYAFQYNWSLIEYQYIRDAFNSNVELLDLGQVGGTPFYTLVSGTAEARYRILPPLYATAEFSFSYDLVGLSRPDKRGLFQPAVRISLILALPFSFGAK